jgi:hypothetical protein
MKVYKPNNKERKDEARVAVYYTVSAHCNFVTFSTTFWSSALVSA